MVTEGIHGKIHTVILLDQMLDESEIDKKFEDMKEDVRDWLDDYDEPTLTKILKRHGLSGVVLDYTECFY